MSTNRPVTFRDCAIELDRTSDFGMFMYNRDNMACSYWSGGSKMIDMANPLTTETVEMYLPGDFLEPGKYALRGGESEQQ